MPETTDLTNMRRRDRAQDDDWIKPFLHRAAFGNLATVQNGQPFINSNLFVFDEAAHAIYMHTARTGRTPDNLGEPSRVCFSTSEMGRMLPAEVALEFSVEYKGVVVFGLATLLSDQSEAEHALQILLDKYAPHLKPGRDYRPIQVEELKRTSVYRIDIESWSGKQKQVEEEFPGAFWYSSQISEG